MKKTDKTGERYQNKQGLWYEIIEYKKNNDITVRFDIDGIIREHCQYHDLRQGCCMHPNSKTSRIGERYKNKQGLWFEIIEYKDSRNVTVKFDIDNKIKKNCMYKTIIKGYCPHPKNDEMFSHIGERYQNTQGLWYEIIEYKNQREVTIKFDIDGTIKEHCYLSSIKNGKCCHPDIFTSRVGERYRNTQGLWFEIIIFRNSKDVDIKFDDGTVKKHCLYKNVKNGICPHPNNKEIFSKIGERYQNTQGLWFEIIEYKNNKDVTVRFDIDGTVKEHCIYAEIRDKSCIHPNNKEIFSKIGERYQNTQGLWFEIIEYIGATDITIKFDIDGIIKEHCQYSNIKKGRCPHPTMKIFGFSIKKMAFKENDKEYFPCICEKCGLEEVMTLEEMKEHSKICGNKF